MWTKGTKVRTLTNKNASDWISEARANCRWNTDGVIVQSSSSHGLCYEVRHGFLKAWYEPDELELAESERILTKSW